MQHEVDLAVEAHRATLDQLGPPLYTMNWVLEGVTISSWAALVTHSLQDSRLAFRSGCSIN